MTTHKDDRSSMNGKAQSSTFVGHPTQEVSQWTFRSPLSQVCTCPHIWNNTLTLMIGKMNMSTKKEKEKKRLISNTFLKVSNCMTLATFNPKKLKENVNVDPAFRLNAFPTRMTSLIFIWKIDFYWLRKMIWSRHLFLFYF